MWHWMEVDMERRFRDQVFVTLDPGRGEHRLSKTRTRGQGVWHMASGQIYQ